MDAKATISASEARFGSLLLCLSLFPPDSISCERDELREEDDEGAQAVRFSRLVDRLMPDWADGEAPDWPDSDARCSLLSRACFILPVHAPARTTYISSFEESIELFRRKFRTGLASICSFEASIE